MALKPYAMVINGYETTLLLSDEDAKKQGVFESPPEQKKAPAPPNKARRAPNKAK